MAPLLPVQWGPILEVILSSLQLVLRLIREGLDPVVELEELKSVVPEIEAIDHRLLEEARRGLFQKSLPQNDALSAAALFVRDLQRAGVDLQSIREICLAEGKSARLSMLANAIPK